MRREQRVVDQLHLLTRAQRADMQDRIPVAAQHRPHLGHRVVAATGSADAFIARVGEFISKDVAVVRRTAAELDSDLGQLEGLLDTATNSRQSGIAT